jgi:hypothetical protein
VSRPKDEKVVIAYLHPGLVSAAFMESVVDLLVYDTAFHQRIVSGGGRLATQSGANLSGPRNGLVKRFLEYGKADWLFMVDTDMTFKPDTIERLLEFADPDEAPIVGGLCFGFDDKGQIQPTLFGLVGDERHPQVIRYHEWPPESMFQVAATGAACLLIHKKALETIRDVQVRPGKRGFNDAFPWFQELEHDGAPVSEDIAFCWRAGLCSIPVFVNTAVHIGHIKERELTIDAYLAQRGGFNGEGEGDVQRLRGLSGDVPVAARGAGGGPGRSDGGSAPGVVHRAPGGAAEDADTARFSGGGFLNPATEPTAVIVPVLRRPQNAEPFMESVHTTSQWATVYAVASDDDVETIAAWKKAGAIVVTIPGVTFAEKMNAGFRATGEPWLLMVGDDVKFHPHWLDYAQQVARDGYDVIGTNDLGNPRVVAGEHATHLLIRRSYVERQGASWDGPGVVCHEGYRHWFVDDEIVSVAKQRGVWAMAPNAIVEHLHPAWGKGETDEVYTLGQSFAAADGALFENRAAANGMAVV